MSDDWVGSGDVTVYVVPKVKKKFDEEFARLLKKSAGHDVLPHRLDDDMTEWVATRAHGHERVKGQRSPGAKALWRAFRALAAARYHFREDEAADKELRELRDRVEALWMEKSP